MSKEIKKEMFTGNLPTKDGTAFHKGRTVIDWEKSVGLKVKFVYGDIEGEVEILSYNSSNGRLNIKYGDKIKHDVSTSTFKNCKIGELLKKVTKDFKIEMSANLIDEKRDITIINRETRRVEYLKKGKTYFKNEKWYKYHCNKCNYEDWRIEGAMLQEQGCSACCSNPQVTVLGINTIWDTDRWMCDLGVSEEDAKSNTKCSGKKITVRCPDCGKFKYAQISKIYLYKSIACSCGDGKSYPEKIMTSILDQISIDYETEYSPSYFIVKGGRKRSDFYIPSLNLVIETDGILGHKGGKLHSNSKKTLEEHISGDKWKDEQHLLHGIKTIRINCFKSDIEYIRNNVINSELANYFDLNRVDWAECNNFAIKNIIKEVCDYWNKKEETESAKDLANKFKLDKSTISVYLKKGTELGWCDYNASYESFKGSSKGSKKIEIFKDGISIDVLDSLSELKRVSMKRFGCKLDTGCVSKVCNGIRNHHQGYTFKYVDN